ncbi:MAG: Ig-like domain-containing protein, partial [Fibrobacteria bacterium]
MASSATKPKFPFQLRLILALGLAALGLFLACNVDNSPGTPVTELKFQTIADSLQTAGYDALQISVTRTDGSDSSSLVKGELGPGTQIGVITLPDSLGKSYRIIVQATKSGDPGLLFIKTYVVAEGIVASGTIVVIPGTGSGASAPTGVVIEADYLTLVDGGDSAPLAARVLPYPEAKQDVAWSSSNTAVATVSAGGLVQSGTSGKAKIIAAAAADGTKSASIDVTVSKLQPVDSVVVDPHALRYFLGMPKSALTLRMVPASAPPLVVWSSSNQAVATVSLEGKVTGLAAGSAYVRAKFKGDAAIGDSCKVTVVKDPPVLNVGQDISVEVGA